jgi:ATP-dependent Clp protease ATP-binding subunit ClpC
MTSNIGADLIKSQSSLGFKKTDGGVSHEKMKTILRAEIEKHFRPEFLNRLDDVIFFKALTRDDLRLIVDIEMLHVKSRLGERGLALELSDEAKEFLINKGYNPDFGARPLRRAIENLIEDPLSEEVLRGTFASAAGIIVRVKDDHLYFEAQGEKTAQTPEAVNA